MIIQGKVYQYINALEVTNTETAGIYVHDPEMQNTTRNGPLYLPTSATAADKAKCLTIFSDLKTELEHCNNYVHDFLQISDIPINDLEEA